MNAKSYLILAAGLVFSSLVSSLVVACDSSGGSSGTSGTGDSGSSGVGDSGYDGTSPPDQDEAGSIGTQGGSDAGRDGPPPPVDVTYVPGVTVSTIAGSDTSGTADGTGSAAQFDNPTGIAIDGSGNLLVTDYDDGRVRYVTPAGVVTTIAAGAGFADPFFPVVASDGRFYVGTDADSTGTKTTTSGTVWLVKPVSGQVVLPTIVAKGFYRPRGIAPMSGGNLFLADRDLDVTEEVSVSAGTSTPIAGSSGVPGGANGTGTAAQFNTPVGAAAMPDGTFLVTDSANNVIRKVTAAGVVTTFAGNGTVGLIDGPCATASFNAPRGVAVDTAGNVYVSDIGDDVIRRIDTTCVVKTLAGTPLQMGFADGAGNMALFYGQEGITVTPDGLTVYVADGNGGDGSNHQRIRALTIPTGE